MKKRGLLLGALCVTDRVNFLILSSNIAIFSLERMSLCYFKPTWVCVVLHRKLTYAAQNQYRGHMEKYTLK